MLWRIAFFFVLISHLANAQTAEQQFALRFHFYEDLRVGTVLIPLKKGERTFLGRGERDSIADYNAAMIQSAVNAHFSRIFFFMEDDRDAIMRGEYDGKLLDGERQPVSAVFLSDFGTFIIHLEEAPHLLIPEVVKMKQKGDRVKCSLNEFGTRLSAKTRATPYEKDMNKTMRKNRWESKEQLLKGLDTLLKGLEGSFRESGNSDVEAIEHRRTDHSPAFLGDASIQKSLVLTRWHVPRVRFSGNTVADLYPCIEVIYHDELDGDVAVERAIQELDRRMTEQLTNNKNMKRKPVAMKMEVSPNPIYW
ncbi:MAG: hypothetical protein KDC12_10815 [Flavobacteriales bacterium]|nr:hypothetical protein [Flavobacteriales bacterium]